MMIDVIGVRRLGDFRLKIEFSDGTVAERDFSFVREKTGPMAEPLKDPEMKKVELLHRVHAAV
jgi:hypothetical protein